MLGSRSTTVVLLGSAVFRAWSGSDRMSFRGGGQSVPRQPALYAKRQGSWIGSVPPTAPQAMQTPACNGAGKTLRWLKVYYRTASGCAEHSFHSASRVAKNDPIGLS